MSHQVARATRARCSVRLAGSLVVGATLAFSLVARAQEATSNVAPAGATTEQVNFDIPAQPLGSAVIAFAEQAGVQVFFDSGKLAGLQSRELKGQHSAQQGLSLLLGGLPVSYSFTGERRVNVERLTEVGGTLQIDATTIESTRDARNEWIYQAPRSVSVITREQLDRNPPRHAADMLVETPGVYSAVSAQDPGLSVNIRGMQDFGRVNTMIDGMRQNFNENGHQQRNGQLYVDSELISSVVIEKGPRSDVTGATSIAGSANFGTLNVDDILLPGQDQGARLRGMTGLGGYANGVNFIGSAAVAGRFGDRWELLAARSRRSFGDYAPGSRRENFDFLTAGVQDGREGVTQVVDRIKFSDQEQDSELFKGRLKLTPEQALQFTYVGTELSYNNVSDRRVANAVDGSAIDGDEAWAKFGDASARSQSFGLDYTFTPDSPWIDLNAKLYYVTTRNERYTAAGRPIVTGGVDMTETAWRLGFCRQNPIPDSWTQECEAGLGNETHTRIDTYGFKLDNTARFAIAGQEGFSFNHGLEYFLDKGTSKSSSDYQGEAFTSSSNTLNPNGKRSIASAFGNLTYETDAITLSAGLRYDYYHLKGKTQVPGTEWTYQTRLERFISRNTTSLINARNNCADLTLSERARRVACNSIPSLEAALADPTSVSNFYTSGNYAPQWLSNPGMYDYDVDESITKLLPTLSAAYRPTGWLELFANWGESWRPPTLTESLMEGSHPGDPFARMYPNTYADPETSRSWELGFNVSALGLVSPGDRFQAKVAYYDTRVDNYLITSIVNTLPGRTGGLGNTMFVNNQVPMNFRGIEFEFDYDARRWYTGINYTHVLGGDNDICQKVYPLGSANIREDMPLEDGTYSDFHNAAIAAGYDSYEAYLDALENCDGDVYGMNSARNLPMDRGSWVVGTRWFNESLELGARLNYSAAGGPEDWSYDLWPSYTTWDLFASYRVSRNLLLRATVENIRDRSYVSGYSDIFTKSYGPGRTVMGGFELQF
ncbi:heme acquisition protein HasR [Pseudomonas flavescens]|uniref:Heme acquisition protein HasR n=1 Tax=Phytopseudomonas flavescens TaxID=29435 RepID=A0A1G8AJC8_9GAMM|nr:TonB-dependent hemoglobin/transferrin/lactoferrin family receptor [Pseudomonas flavescens]SDH21112.1 heme acquisition protein HasR [Pseudomonas flavescens]